MSRIGKKPISIPEKTSVEVLSDAVSVKGPKGELSKSTHPRVTVEVVEGEVTVTPADSSKESRSLWGTTASHISNMIHGVNEGYEKKLIIEGVGYRANVSGNTLVLSVGYSHDVELEIPEGLEVSVEKNEITVKGINKETVGEFAATIRSKRKPEPYKGKGIRYADEVIRRKEGKKTV